MSFLPFQSQQATLSRIVATARRTGLRRCRGFGATCCPIGHILEEQQAWIFTTETSDWLEGKRPPDEAFGPAALLIKATGKQVFVFAGEEMRPHTQDQRATGAFRFGPEPDYSPDQENGYYWVECPFCRKLALQRAGGVTGDYCEHMQRLFKILIADLQPRLDGPGNTAEETHYQWWLAKVANLMITDDSPRIDTAYIAARLARFELAP